MAVFNDDDKNAVDEQNETTWLIFACDVFDYDSSLVSNSFLSEVKNRESEHFIYPVWLNMTL